MPVTSLAAAKALDGRQSRTARSRLAICEACVDLVQEGTLQPSADEIAERAGVSRRSIFNHFADLAELYDAVVEVGMQRWAPLLEDISDQEPVARRIDQLVRVRSKFLEATSVFTRALTAQALVGQAADHALRVSKNALQRHHEEVERLFERDLEGLSSSDRAEVLEAMGAAMAPLLWESLRRSRGNSESRTRAIMKRMLTSILRDAGVDA
jgi:AcrR family transcriptional regulator